MSKDIVSDGLNQMMNARKAGKERVELKYSSKFFLSVLAIAKLKGYVRDFRVENGILIIEFDKLNECKSIKPRYVVRATEIDKYVTRYLPAKNMGVVIVSTSQGLMTHQTAMEKNLGGSLIAYMY